MSMYDQPIGITSIPNNRYLGIRYMTFEDGIRREEVYTGEYLILTVGTDGNLRGKVLDYFDLEIEAFKVFDCENDESQDSDEYTIVSEITKERIEGWVDTYEYEEVDNPIEMVLDAIYSHVYKNLFITEEAKAYLETLKKKINYKNGK